MAVKTVRIGMVATISIKTTKTGITPMAVVVTMVAVVTMVKVVEMVVVAGTKIPTNPGEMGGIGAMDKIGKVSISYKSILEKLNIYLIFKVNVPINIALSINNVVTSGTNVE